MQSSRCLYCVCLLLFSFVAQTKTLGQQSADEVKSVSSAPRKLLEVKAVEQHAAYWSSEPGWDTELQLRNNLPSESLSVTPVLRLPSGKEIPLDAVNIPANGTTSVSVNAGLQQHGPNLVGRSGSYGSLVFRFQARNPMNLYATAVPSMQSVPVSFRIQAQTSNAPDELSSNGPGTLEGIWWKARTGLTDVLIITNPSNTEVSGTLSLFDSGGKRWSEPLSLTSHQTVRVLVSDLLREAGLTGNFGGLSYDGSSMTTALDAVHLMYDEGGKFSGSLEVFHSVSAATASQHSGGTTQVQLEMRAPMLALRTPDPALGLPAKTFMQPLILVRNTTAQKIAADVALNWHSDSSKGQAKLPQLTLAPFATKELPIWTMQDQLGIPADAHWGLVSLTSSSRPGGLIAVASSRDCTGEYNADTKFISGQGGRFAGGQWRLDATHNHITAITNVSTQGTDALVTLHYGTGEQKYEIQQAIAPGEQMWVNLGQLVRQRVADRNGNFLPVDTNTVTYDVEDLTPGSHSLIANDLSVDTAAGQAIPDCPFCCGFYASEFFIPDPVDMLLGSTDPLQIGGIYACNNRQVGITSSFTDWWSGDSNVAEVSYAKAQSVSAGQTTGYAQGIIFGPGQCACNPVLRTVSVPVTVQKISFLRVVSTSTDKSVCLGLGCATDVTYQVVDQNGNPVRIAGMTVKEALSGNTTCSNGTIENYGSWTTDATGKLTGADEVYFCCPQGQNCGMTLNQTFTVNGQPVLIMGQNGVTTGAKNVITISCTNGQASCANIVITP